MAERTGTVQQGEGAEVVDRYSALGITPNGCEGPCEGTGVVPVLSDDDDEALVALWLRAEAAEPTENGWHFVPCPECSPEAKP